LFGVAKTTGARTKKNSNGGVKNKYCKKCYYLFVKNLKSTHTSMEAAINLDGFKQSLNMHELQFKNIIGDRNQQCIKKIWNARPYGSGYFIHKIECRNHI
jgi:hypothetical protein